LYKRQLLDLATANWLRAHQREAFLSAGRNLAAIAGGVPVETRHYDHHLCHAAFACASSPFEDAHCLILDGEGEVGAVSHYRLHARKLARNWRSWGPGSLGAFYAFLTLQCGFDWRAGEEWKVMGLAAFGRPRAEAKAALARLVEIDRGRPRAAEPAVWDEVADALAGFRRAAGRDVMLGADLAASGQAVYAALADRILADIGILPGENLVLGGGCALNSSYNGTLRTRFGLAGVHVPCAPADDGNAAGAALLAWQQDRDGASLPYDCDTPYLGSAPEGVDDAVAAAGFARTIKLAGNGTALVAERLARGDIVGVMRGRAEFGPRALGNRSILADPRGPGMKDRLNKEVKGREPYRPFAPVVAADEAGDWFEAPTPSRYMSFTSRWRRDKAGRVPAVVHEDGTGRLQTVTETANPWLAALVRDFGRATGTPVLLNTSLNVMGKPIAHSIADALTIFATTGMDALVLGDLLIEKG
jgi:carbamoyltransferase